MTTTSYANVPDEPGVTNTRFLVRKAAAEIANGGEYPTPELVRRKIQGDTNGRLNPSNTTVHDELKKWRQDTFWPTFSAFGALPQDSAVPDAVRQAYTEAYRMIVVHLLEKSRSDWSDERLELLRQLEEADRAAAAQRELTDALEEQVATLREQLSRETEQLRQAQAANATLAQEKSELATDLKQALQQQAAHERELNEVREAERRRAEAAADAARLEQNRLHVEIDTARQTAKRHETAAAAAAAEAARAKERVTNLEHDLSAVRMELASAKEAHAREAAHLSQALASARAAAHHTEQGRKMAPQARERAKRPIRQSLRKPRSR